MRRLTIYQRKRREVHNTSIEVVTRTLLPDFEGAYDVEVKIAPFLSNGLLRRLCIALDAWRVRTNVFHVTGDINFAALLRPRRGVVLSILDTAALEAATGFRRKVLRAFWLALPVRRAQAVVTISQFSRDAIVRHLGYDPGNIVVIPVPVPSFFKASPKPFDEVRPRILQVGTAANKNFERVVEAVAGVSCRLCILGPLSESIKARMKELAIEYESHLNVSDDQLRRLYEGCDLVTFCSTYEGFGMPVVEANAVGRPVVTSNVCSLPEVAGDAALTVDPEDITAIRSAILRLIGDAELRRKLVENGFVNARRFDKHEIARQFLRVFDLADRG